MRAAMLSDACEVITYDRRCSARSPGGTGAPFGMAQQARGAVAVLRAAGHPKALVFGSSGGASTALQLGSRRTRAASRSWPCMRRRPWGC